MHKHYELLLDDLKASVISENVEAEAFLCGFRLSMYKHVIAHEPITTCWHLFIEPYPKDRSTLSEDIQWVKKLAAYLGAYDDNQISNGLDPTSRWAWHEAKR